MMAMISPSLKARRPRLLALSMGTEGWVRQITSPTGERAPFGNLDGHLNPAVSPVIFIRGDRIDALPFRRPPLARGFQDRVADTA